MSSNIPAQIAEMARLTVFTGQINEVQEKNLKMYPLIYFNCIESVKIDYDLSKIKTVGDGSETSNSRVSYYLTLDASKNDILDKRFSAVEKCVRTLFWNNLTVEIYFNDKIVYKSAL